MGGEGVGIGVKTWRSMSLPRRMWPVLTEADQARLEGREGAHGLERGDAHGEEAARAKVALGELGEGEEGVADLAVGGRSAGR